MEVKVRKGDSLWYYSQLFAIPINILLEANRDVNPTALQIGQRIKIPGYVSENYVVRAGDTFYSIANRRNVPLDGILILNQDVSPNMLQIGQRIIVPIKVISRVVTSDRAYDSAILDRDLDRLETIYPFIDRKVIGRSVEGKPIEEIIVGTGERLIQINASFHANEWITTPVLMRFLNDYLLALTNQSAIRGIDVKPLFTKNKVSFIPMVNPDGVDLVIKGPPQNKKEEILAINNGSNDFTGWKANIRGVDLNNQYPAKWEIERDRKPFKEPAPRDYPGPSPLSEPEAKVMADLANEKPFQRMLALHTQGKEFYWGYEGLEPEESQELAKDFERVSGYRSVQYVDSYAGYKDWFIQEFQQAGFTMELGRGINPLPLSQFEQIYEEMLGVFLVTLYK
ncbi:M14 family metallopeptidase [Mangrovibacillus cuniculi]|uniref:LysM peptidoglycan-binding domain-containing protein n=1 Tax=Mangrovibacillus cuniculi TaxID=2593652 RepID=A0A7S8CBD2_9BACI|nr:M14 family metallopeptidase [Mangrovibacillus cuniculi]QPC46869.1 LysM peptidoglycan-binding domain-containing protein [Mangrovibacillus cuniculi]